MSRVTQERIEELITDLSENETAFNESFQKFKNEYPALAAYIFSEHSEAFTEDEKHWLLFASLVIYESISESYAQDEDITEEFLIDLEEKNWDLLQQTSANRFRERMNVFFENYPEEEILAFIEDTLEEDEEEDFITKEGREPMFVILKTVSDALLSR